MTDRTERLVIEERTSLGWDACGYPNPDPVEAAAALARLREIESKKRFPHELRLVRITREIIG